MVVRRPLAARRTAARGIVRVLAVVCLLIAVVAVVLALPDSDWANLRVFPLSGFGFLTAFLGFFPGFSWGPGELALALLLVALACGFAVLSCTYRSNRPERRTAASGIIVACLGLVLGGVGYAATVVLAALILASYHLSRTASKERREGTGANVDGKHAPRSRLAEGALMTGLLLGPAGWLAVPLGHASLRRIKRTGEEGRPLAVAALVIGYLWIAGVVWFIGLAVVMSFSIIE